MVANLKDEDWILYGDWNMTNLFDDVVGSSAFIHGLKMRAWNRIVDKLDLVDNYLCAYVRLGPHFTRQADKADRYDQSRLDHNYSRKRNN